jgi:N-carbamoyl-L-amino-acid hydrolase
MSGVASLQGLPEPDWALADALFAHVVAGQGIDAAMLCISNANGSHNPHEAMAVEDFREAMGCWRGD